MSDTAVMFNSCRTRRVTGQNLYQWVPRLPSCVVPGCKHCAIDAAYLNAPQDQRTIMPGHCSCLHAFRLAVTSSLVLMSCGGSSLFLTGHACVAHHITVSHRACMCDSSHHCFSHSQDLRKPGSQAEKGSFVGLETAFNPVGNGYPGGPFDPLRLSK
jgi:hypothetical protein